MYKRLAAFEVAFLTFHLYAIQQKLVYFFAFEKKTHDRIIANKIHTHMFCSCVHCELMIAILMHSANSSHLFRAINFPQTRIT